MHHPVLLRCVRGIEPVVLAEAEALLGPLSAVVAHRSVRFAAPSLRPLLSLGCADDAFLVVAEGEGPSRVRASLRALDALAARIDGAAVVAALAPLRGLPRVAAFTVTASFVGRRNYSRFEVEERVAHAVAAATGWRPAPRGAALGLRVHLDHESATFAVRLAAAPLHRRAYRVASRPGALHPPLARAMVWLAVPPPGGRLLDPMCGVGTIPIEAALHDPCVRTIAFDLDPGAVRAARVNARQAGVALRAATADATALPLADDSVDAIVTNPPWGRAIAAGGGLRRERRALWRELGRVLAPDGRLVALVPEGDGLPIRVHGAEAVIVSKSADAVRRQG